MIAVINATPLSNPHGAAFAEVQECLAAAIRDLGHKCVEYRPYIVRKALNIVLGGQFLSGPIPDDTIIFNLEQHGSPWMTAGYLNLLRTHRVWDYSATNIEQLRALGVERIEHVPLGYHQCLTRIEPAREDVDVLFYGSMNTRRNAVLNQLTERGLKAVNVFGWYGRDRDALIASSKIVLNMHFYPSSVFESVRVSYLLANKRCVVSERGNDDDFEGGVAFADYIGLAERCHQLVRDDAERARIAAAGFEIMRARPQVLPSLEAALA